MEDSFLLKFDDEVDKVLQQIITFGGLPNHFRKKKRIIPTLNKLSKQIYLIHKT